VKSALALAYYTYQEQIPKVYCLVSDTAPEYNKIAIEHQALCWVHDARYYKKLQPVLERHREKLVDFDALFSIKTNYFQLDKLINKTFK
jgi:hypothetical protein